MKRYVRWLKDIFNPGDYNGLDVDAIRSAFNDSSIRSTWLNNCFEELKTINREVDRRLLTGTNLQLTDLCARRKAYQDMLEAVLSARRQITQDVRPNPKVQVDINLDRVTA
jgi:hypothetical protein